LERSVQRSSDPPDQVLRGVDRFANLPLGRGILGIIDEIMPFTAHPAETEDEVRIFVPELLTGEIDDRFMRAQIMAW
jgi:hypothetical protein